MQKIIVVNNTRDWEFDTEGVEIVNARTYLTDNKYTEVKNARIFNLCRSYRYQSIGYYVSLLAEARGHRAIPNITTIQDLKSQTIIRVISDNIDDLIQQNLGQLKSRKFDLSIYFGKNTAKRYEELSKQLYNLFQAPLLRAKFVRHKHWELQDISPIPLNQIPEDHKPYIAQFAKEYFSRKRFVLPRNSKSIYDLAILVNPQEKVPPSNERAIQKFIKAAENLGFDTELITKDDYSRVAEFDALFIRETTSVNHHTYRFARRAFRNGLAVIDDPESILKCTNKVYLAELLNKAKIITPKTVIVHRDNRETIESHLGLPCILKKPDSSFSQGVVKLTDRESLRESMDMLMDKSDLVIAQEFLPTEFDWRIGVLDRTPMYACRYYMAEGHWQVLNWGSEAKEIYGNVDTLDINNVPENVVQTALKAANLIGDGFYGVDLKQANDQVYVIEINDNPSVESGIEDYIIGDKLYLAVMNSLFRRIEQRKRLNSANLR